MYYEFMLAKNKKNKRGVPWKKIFLFVVCGGIFIFFASLLVVGNINISKKRAVLASQQALLEKETQTAKEKNEEIKESVASGPDYVEKVAREKLNMKASGEKVVVVQRSGKTASAVNAEEGKPFFKKWWDIFKDKMGY
jgi:cell division protein FtsB